MCGKCEECTAWVTNAPQQKEEISCWLHGGQASFEADADRNSGLPCRAPDSIKAQEAAKRASESLRHGPKPVAHKQFQKASGKASGKGIGKASGKAVSRTDVQIKG